MAGTRNTKAGLGRLLAVSLGAAVLAVVVSKLRGRSTPLPGQTDETDTTFNPRPSRRSRSTRRPDAPVTGTATAAAAEASDQASESDPVAEQPAEKIKLAGRARAIARPVMPASRKDSATAPPLATRPPDQPTTAEETAGPANLTDNPVVQAAVETTEIDPFAWPEPPAPPPVVPADTMLSTLVNDTTAPACTAEDASAQAPDTAVAPATAHVDTAGVRTATPDTASIDTQAADTQGADTQGADTDAGTGGLGSADSTDQAASATAPASSGPFYGWILVAAVFIILCITSGVGFYNASVILSAATRELGASVGAVSGATGLFFAIGGLTGFVFAKRMEFVDIRWFFVAGGLVGGAALVGLRWVTSIPGLYVFFAVFGVAFGLAGLVPATTLITRWFDRRRSVALSIASTGLSVGGIVVTPFSDWLIDQRTLSGAAPYLAAMWVVGVIPMAVLFVRSYPSDKGLRPDGDPAPAPAPVSVTAPLQSINDGATASESSGAASQSANQPAETVPGLAFAKARTTRFFIALCFAYAVIFFGQVGGIAQLFNMILERTDAPTARTALATLAGSSVIFRLLGGAAVTRLPTKSFSAALAVVQAAALVLLAVTNSSTGLILSAAFFGCSIGNLLMLQPLLLAEAFGVANYGRIYSFNQLFGTIGLASGPLTLGLIHDASDYRNAFFAAAAASFIGCLAIVSAGPTTKVQALWR